MLEKAVERLRIAYKTEISGYNFYCEASDLVKDERGKNLFRHLAADELEHIKVVLSISESLNKGGGWLSYEEAVKKGEKSIDMESLPVFPNKLLEELKDNANEVQAIKIGIDVEDKSIKLYSEMLKGASEPAEKVVLIKLVDMERAHLKLLRWEEESLVHTGFWCDFMEFNIEKEIY